MDAKHVHRGEWYLYLQRYPWLIIGEDNDFTEPAFRAVDDYGFEGIVFASELTPVEI
jgi:hypothetical protein